MLIPDLEALDRALEPIMAGDVAEAAIDTETTEVRDDRFTAFGTDTRQAGVSIAYRPSPDAEPYAFYIPLRHRPYDWRRARPLILKAAPARVERLERDENVGPAGWADGRDPNLPLEPVLDRLRDAFRTRTHWWLHNALFDFGMFVADGLPVPAAWGDTQFLSIYTDPRAIDEYSEDLEVQTEDGVKRGGFLHQGHGLKHLGEAFLGRPADAQKLLGEARAVLKCDDYSMLPLRTIVTPYACEDVVLAASAVDDGQAQVGVDGPALAMHAEVIRPAVAQPLGEDRLGAGQDFGRYVVLVLDACDAAHGRSEPCGSWGDSAILRCSPPHLSGKKTPLWGEFRPSAATRPRPSAVRRRPWARPAERRLPAPAR